MGGSCARALERERAWGFRVAADRLPARLQRCRGDAEVLLKCWRRAKSGWEEHKVRALVARTMSTSPTSFAPLPCCSPHPQQLHSPAPACTAVGPRPQVSSWQLPPLQPRPLTSLRTGSPGSRLPHHHASSSNDGGSGRPRAGGGGAGGRRAPQAPLLGHAEHRGGCWPLLRLWLKLCNEQSNARSSLPALCHAQAARPPPPPAAHPNSPSSAPCARHHAEQVGRWRGRGGALRQHQEERHGQGVPPAVPA